MYHRKASEQIFDKCRYQNWLFEICKGDCIHSKTRLEIIITLFPIISVRKCKVTYQLIDQANHAVKVILNRQVKAVFPFNFYCCDAMSDGRQGRG